MKLFQSTMRGVWNPSLVTNLIDALRDSAYSAHHAFLNRIGGHPIELIGELRCKNLACYCDLSEACHGDILLEFANPSRS